MADVADDPMTIEAFLAWADTREGTYELVDGAPAPLWPPDPAEPGRIGSPTIRHQRVIGNVLDVVESRVTPPCWATFGLLVPVRRGTARVADVVVTRESADGSAQRVDAPNLVVEVFSPVTEAVDRGVKLDEYKQLASVREIWLIASDPRWVQVWRRKADDAWTGFDVIGRGGFESRELGSRVTLNELYKGVGL